MNELSADCGNPNQGSENYLISATNNKGVYTLYNPTPKIRAFQGSEKASKRNIFAMILHSNDEYLNSIKTKISEFSLKALEILALQPLQPFFSKYLGFAFFLRGSKNRF